MIYKCENCKNRISCSEKQEGYKNLCKIIETTDRDYWHDCYYTLTLKCDYWVEDKETCKEVSETPCITEK